MSRISTRRLTKAVHSVFAGLMLAGTSQMIAKPAGDHPGAALVQAKQSSIVLDAKYRASTNASDFVIVEFRVAKSGSVLRPRVLASTQPGLSSKVLKSISKWRFEPSNKETRVRQRIVFE